MLFDPTATDEDTRLEADQFLENNFPKEIASDVDKVFEGQDSLGRTRNRKLKLPVTLRDRYLKLHIWTFIQEMILPRGVFLILVDVIILVLGQLFGQSRHINMGIFSSPVMSSVVLISVMLLRYIFLNVYFGLNKSMIHDVKIETFDFSLVCLVWSGTWLFLESLSLTVHPVCQLTSQEYKDDVVTTRVSKRSDKKVLTPEDFPVHETNVLKLPGCMYHYLFPDDLPEVIDIFQPNDITIQAIPNSVRDQWTTGVHSYYTVDEVWANSDNWIIHNSRVEQLTNRFKMHERVMFKTTTWGKELIRVEDLVWHDLFIVAILIWSIKAFIRDTLVYGFRARLTRPLKSEVSRYFQVIDMLETFSTNLTKSAEKVISFNEGKTNKNRHPMPDWYSCNKSDDLSKSNDTSTDDASDIDAHSRMHCLFRPKEMRTALKYLRVGDNPRMDDDRHTLALCELINRDPEIRIDIDIVADDGEQLQTVGLEIQNLTESLIIGAIFYRTFSFVHNDERMKNGKSTNHTLSVESLNSCNPITLDSFLSGDNPIDRLKASAYEKMIITNLNKALDDEEGEMSSNGTLQTISVSRSLSKKHRAPKYDSSEKLSDLFMTTSDSTFLNSPRGREATVTFNMDPVHGSPLSDDEGHHDKRNMSSFDKVKRCVEWLIALHARRFKEENESDLPSFHLSLMKHYLTDDELTAFRFRSMKSNHQTLINQDFFSHIFIDLDATRTTILTSLDNQRQMADVFGRIVNSFAVVILVFFFLIFLGIPVGTVILSGAAALATLASFLSVVYRDYAESILLTCVINPFSVGERIKLGFDGDDAVVEKIHTFFSTFLLADGKSLAVPHAQLNQMPILNYTRTTTSTLSLTFQLDADTSDIRYRALEELLYQYSMTRPESIIPDSFMMMLTDFQPGHFLQLDIYFVTPLSFHFLLVIYQIKEEFILYMRQMCLALNVTYKLPTKRLQFPQQTDMKFLNNRPK